MARRLRRRPIIKITLGQRIVFARKAQISLVFYWDCWPRVAMNPFPMQRQTTVTTQLKQLLLFVFSLCRGVCVWRTGVITTLVMQLTLWLNWQRSGIMMWESVVRPLLHCYNGLLRKLFSSVLTAQLSSTVIHIFTTKHNEYRKTKYIQGVRYACEHALLKQMASMPSDWYVLSPKLFCSQSSHATV